MQSLYFGDNNGEIALSCRRIGSELNMTKNTALRALGELRDHGLIVRTSKGKYLGRVASTYRLTHIGTQTMPATKEYQCWDNRVKKLIAQ
jgi:predicted ArsR family transcriptional regulator